MALRCLLGAGGCGYAWPSWSCVATGWEDWLYTAGVFFEPGVLIECLHLPPLLVCSLFTEELAADSLLLFSPSPFLVNGKRKVIGFRWTPGFQSCFAIYSCVALDVWLHLSGPWYNGEPSTCLMGLLCPRLEKPRRGMGTMLPPADVYSALHKRQVHCKCVTMY